MVQFNVLERAILDEIIKRTEDAALREQLQACSALDRDYTRAGFYLGLEVPEGSRRSELDLFDGPDISAKELDCGGGCLVKLEDGHLHYLEIFSNDCNFPEQLRSFVLSWSAA